MNLQDYHNTVVTLKAYISIYCFHSLVVVINDTAY